MKIIFGLVLLFAFCSSQIRDPKECDEVKWTEYTDAYSSSAAYENLITNYGTSLEEAKECKEIASIWNGALDMENFFDEACGDKGTTKAKVTALKEAAEKKMEGINDCEKSAIC